MEKTVNLLNIQWERMYLKVTTEKLPEGCSLWIEDMTNNKKTEIISEIITDETNTTFTIIITSALPRTMIEPGRYLFVVFKENNWSNLSIPQHLIQRIVNFSQIFYYGNYNYSYNVSFEASIENKEPLLVLRTMFMAKNDNYRKTNLWTGSWKRFLSNIVVRIIQFGINCVYRFLSLVMPKNGKRVLFMSQTKSALSANLDAIASRMKERKMDDYKIYFSTTNILSGKLNIWAWVKITCVLANKDFIFLDDYTPILSFLNLDKRTKLIQVWHAGVGFKSCGYSRFGLPDSPHPFQSCHRKYDYAVVGSELLIPDYIEVFGIPKTAFIPSGLPRLDDYLDEGKIEEFKTSFYNKYPSFKSKKIILFAPTFRGKGQLEADYDYSQIDFERLDKACKDEYVVLFKMHPFVTEPIPIPTIYADKMFDVFNEKDINELFYVTDLLITDYSSNIYEFSLFQKPMLFFAYDELEYTVTRGIYKPFEEVAPGKVCHTFEELARSIEQSDFDIHKQENYYHYGFHTTKQKAADEIIDVVFCGKEI